MIIIKALKFIIVAVLSVFYWPLNTVFLFFQKHYRRWKEEDKISFYLATPLYYLTFLIVAIFSIPLEILGADLHPPLGGFR